MLITKATKTEVKVTSLSCDFLFFFFLNVSLLSQSQVVICHVASLNRVSPLSPAENCLRRHPSSSVGEVWMEDVSDTLEQSTQHFV